MNNGQYQQIITQMRQAKGTEILRSLRSRLHQTLDKVKTSEAVPDWVERVNQMHDVLSFRIVQLAEAKMVAGGFEKPPVAYAFMLMGSGGRREQTLWSDQDNGLIYADPMNADEQQRCEVYFPRLAGYISDGLEQIGYPPCDGQVICTNPLWNRSFTSWKGLIQGWLDEPNWENFRNLLIASDMRSLPDQGDELIKGVRSFFYSFLRENPELYTKLRNNTLFRKPSLNWFGQLIREKYGEDAGGINIKNGAYIPVVNAVRYLHMRFTDVYTSTSTLKRLDDLYAFDCIAEEVYLKWRSEILTVLKFRAQTVYVRQSNGAYDTTNIISRSQLAGDTKKEVIQCLRVAVEMQRFVQKHGE